MSSIDIFLVGKISGEKVAHRLSKEAKPAVIYSSDLKRAAETAEIIAKVCGVTNVRPFCSFFLKQNGISALCILSVPFLKCLFFQLVLTEALREMHMGYFQGLKWDDIINKNPDAFRGFDIFKITEGSDSDSRNQEIPINSQLSLSRLKW